MNNIKKIIKEIIQQRNLKKDCGCGCNGKCGKNEAPMLNENLTHKSLISEHMQYHIDNKLALTENTFRYGSTSFLNLWKEARKLYSRNLLEVSGLDKDIIVETNLGEYGIYEGQEVPLDLPMIEEGQMLDNYEVDFFHTKANVYANIEIPSENPTFEDDLQIKGIGKTEEEAFEDLKQNYNNYKKTGINEAEYDFNINKVWDFIESRPFNNPNYMPKFSTAKEIWDEWGDKEKQLYSDFQWEDKYNGQLHPKEKANLQRRKNYDTLAGINEAEYQGKDVQLNKPKRGGSKKFYVYVMDPKTKRVKKVSFGAAGGGQNLAVKIRDPKARRAFASRQNCDKKKDRTKPGYWSCNIGRYWKSLGGGSNFSGYW
jgi:hypothetical protein